MTITDQAPRDSRQETAPLWSDDRISVYSWNAPTAFEARRLYDAMKRVRDDYEAKLDEYQAVYLYYIDLAHKADERIVKLEAQLESARKWLPDSALEGDGDNDPAYLGSTTWHGHKVDFFDEGDDDE